MAISETRHYPEAMIVTFADARTEALFRRHRVKHLAIELQPAALRKLAVLDAATSLADLRVPPANRLEALAGGRKGQHSIRINDQWRVCFSWRAGQAYDVEVVDYH